MKRVGISGPFSERERKAVAMEKSAFATRLDHCYEELKWLYKPIQYNCALCRDHERNGFVHGVQLGAQLVQEIQSDK